jgi:Zn-dependent protease
MSHVFQFAVQFLAVLFAISVHESAHAWAADRCGDPSARLRGRISLNPIVHLDLFGSLIFPGIILLMNLVTGGNAPVFGWAKPVMVNPYNFRHPRRDNMLVSAAGPLSNLLLAGIIIIFFVAFKVPILQSGNPIFLLFIYIACQLMIIDVFLAVFNLIPVPPLDGAGILEGLLKGRALEIFEQIKPYGFFILLAILFTNIINVIANVIFKLIFSAFPVLAYIFFKAGAF